MQGYRDQLTLFVMDGWNVIEEHQATFTAQPHGKAAHGATQGSLTRPGKDAKPTLSVRHSWGEDLSGTLQGAGGIGGLLASVHQSPNSPAVPLWFHYDSNGNVILLTDERAQPAARYSYDAFGQTITATGIAANLNRYRFSTKPVESSSGLAYYGYRYYDPVSGKWLNRDPIGEDGGINLYGMVGNNPENTFDVLGLSQDCCRGITFNSATHCCHKEGNVQERKPCAIWISVGCGLDFDADAFNKATQGRDDVKGSCATCGRENNCNKLNGSNRVPDHNGTRNNGWIFPNYDGNYQNHPSFNRDRGDTTVRDAVDKEIANARTEARNMCSGCCSKVEIKLTAQGDKGAIWLLKNNYTKGQTVETVPCNN